MRILIFLLGFLSFVFIEWLLPFKRVTFDKKRFGLNLILGLFGAFVTKVLAPTGLAVLADTFPESGLLNLLGLPLGLHLIFTILILDLGIYFQHRIFHRVSFLWNIHAIHHSDTHLDTSSALRFHPLEIGLSVGIKAALILMFGLSAMGVIIFEVLLNLSAMFNHSNFQLQGKVEKYLRLIIVTPDFHRVHHHPDKGNTNSNYGFFLSLWDRIFGTENNDIVNSSDFGLDHFPKESLGNYWKLLAYPFSRQRKP